MELPSEYLLYLQHGGTIEAFLACEFPSYTQLWPLDKIAEYNDAYELAKSAPGFIGFGSNGGGELLVFDAKGAVYCLPAVGMEPNTQRKVANSWADFARQIETAH